MQTFDKQIRVFGAGFSARPSFSNWARMRARELEAQGKWCCVVVVWGPLVFTVRKLPAADPEFAVRRADGTIERFPQAAE